MRQTASEISSFLLFLLFRWRAKKQRRRTNLDAGEGLLEVVESFSAGQDAEELDPVEREPPVLGHGDGGDGGPARGEEGVEDVEDVDGEVRVGRGQLRVVLDGRKRDLVTEDEKIVSQRERSRERETRREVTDRYRPRW